MENLEMLSENWYALCARMGAKRGVLKTFQILVSQYSDPYRGYHNQDHIAFCLAEFYEVKNLFKNPDEAEMALFMHDSIYNTASNSNESSSAIFSDIMLKYMGIGKKSRNLISEFVMGTKHDKKPKTRDGMMICDIDLAIMGYPWETYEQAGEKIRKEFSWIPEAVGIKMRTDFLNGLLKQDKIFLTDHFREKYEEQTRKNLIRAIEKLQN